MKFHFTFLFSLLFTISAFAQPQKGDYFFGGSNVTFNHIGEGRDFFGFSPAFGAFVANNTLVGGAVSLQGNSGNTQTQLSIFINQFIGKGRLKGLTSFQVTNVSDITFADIQIGAAFFPVDNASINFVYQLIPFATGNGDFQAFPNDVRPNFGLSMRYFLLRNRAEGETILARNSIKEGTKGIGLSGNFESKKNTNTLLVNGTSKFFIKDNFFLTANLRTLSFFYPNASIANQYAVVPQIGAGYYANVSEDFALRFGTLLSFAASNENKASNNSPVLKTRTRSALINAGFAIFKGRHRIEPTIGVDLFSIHVKDATAETVSAANFQVKAEYEYFLSQNTSLTGVFTVLPMNKTFRASRFAAEGNDDYGFNDFEKTAINFVIGFNYYIMR